MPRTRKTKTTAQANAKEAANPLTTLELAEAFNQGVKDQSLGRQFKYFDYAFLKQQLENAIADGKVQVKVLRNPSDFAISIQEAMESTNWAHASVALAYLLDGRQVQARVMSSHNGVRRWFWETEENFKRVLESGTNFPGQAKSRNSNAVYQWRILLHKAISQALADEGIEFELIPIEKIQFEQKVEAKEPHQTSGLSTEDVAPEGSEARRKLDHARGAM